jgi:tyrosinase
MISKIRLTWSLVQQALWANAQAIAQSYPPDQQANYTAAAATWRMPYWDWAVNAALPDVLTAPTVTINAPSGVQNIDNPLFNYSFQSDAAGNGFPSGDPVCSWTACPSHWELTSCRCRDTPGRFDMMINFLE